MRFGTIEYMQWAKTAFPDTRKGEADFVSSGMPLPARMLAELGIDGRDVPLAVDNMYGYAPFREGVAARYGVRPEEVLPALGTSMANFLLLAVLTDPGDRLLIEHPVYECLPAPARSLGLEVIDLPRREEAGWAIDVEEAASLARRHKARGILLSNPHNPSGTVMKDEQLTRLADAVGSGCFLIVDEVYREWTPGEEHRTAGLARPNLFATSSLTKVWGFGSLRAGWAIAPEKVVHRALRALDHVSVVHPAPGDWIAGEVVQRDGLLDDLLDRTREHLAAARMEVDGFLAGPRGGRIRTVMPPAGGFAFWRIEGMEGDEAARRLRVEAKVVTAPGGFFGAPDGMRVAWTRGRLAAAEALRRFGEWLEGQGRN